MGASGWSYFAPYEPDIAAVLYKVWQSIYPIVARRYPTKQEQMEAYEEDLQHLMQFPRKHQEQQERLVKKYSEGLQALRALPEPQTFEEKIIELCVICGGTGTATILDMRGVSDTPTLQKVAPLTAEELTQLLGTAEPTEAQVERQLDALTTFRERNMGSYVVLYEDGRPHLILFCGFSGDWD